VSLLRLLHVSVGKLHGAGHRGDVPEHRGAADCEGGCAQHQCDRSRPHKPLHVAEFRDCRDHFQHSVLLGVLGFWKLKSSSPRWKSGAQKLRITWAEYRLIRLPTGTNSRSKKILQPHINRYIMWGNTPNTTIGRGDLSTLEHTCEIRARVATLHEERAVLTP
jgi:hypothetical protein